MLMAGIATYLIYKKVKQVVHSYTDTAPRELVHNKFPQDQYEKLKERLDNFIDEVKKGNEQNIVLTDAEINALIASHPDLKEFKGIIQFAFENDTVKGEISFPLNQLEIGMVEDRYLNGSAVFDMSIKNGQLYVTLQELEVKGNKITGPIMTQFKNINLAKDSQNNPNLRKNLKYVKSFYIKDDKLYIKIEKHNTTDIDQNP